MRLGQTIVFDIYPAEKGGGYYYDFTRTWSLGYATPEAQELYDQVHEIYNKVMENFDLNAWNAGRIAKRAGQSLTELLAAFDQERAATIAVLQGLPADAWQKAGDHPALGHVTVEYVARIIGLHERSHLQEMMG